MGERNQMPIKLEYSTKDDIPAGYDELYTEKDGKFLLTGVEGLKSQTDIDKIHESLRKERGDHKKTKDTYAFLDGLDLNDVKERLGKYDELKTAAEGKIDDKKIDSIVNGRIKGITDPIERAKAKADADLLAANGTIGELRNTILLRDIGDSVRSAALKDKVVDTALEDVLMIAGSIFTRTEDGRILTKDDLPGVSAGLEPTAWLAEMKEKRPHWWPASEGAGARGGNGAGNSTNPWSKNAWSITEQGKVIREKGADAAARLAKAAGSEIGAVRPPK
jgi:hypothetical protein